MKKFFSAFAIASLMVAASCSNEEFEAQTGKETTVSFTAQLSDGLHTKSYGNGTTASTLTYAVYQVTENGWNLLADFGKTDETINMRKQVSLSLVNGNTYAVVFWADAPQSIYTFDADNKTVSADYANAVSNDETLDAFFAVEQFKVSGASSKTIELRRPFAQLNIGASDLEAAKAAGVEIAEAGVKVKTYNTFNFNTGELSGEADVTFAAAELPQAPEVFPVDGYDYLTMNYLFMPADKKADNAVTIMYGNGSERTFHNVPLQRNYRTNIFGKLFTSDEEFDVVIKPEFDGSYNVNVWDGTTTEEPAVVDGAYQITDASEFAWLSEHQGNGLDKDIKLVEDIDFGGASIQAIRVASSVVSVVIDGNGKSMSNLAVEYAPSSNYAKSLFSLEAVGENAEITVKNLTIKNVNIDNYNKHYGYVGVVISDIQNGAKVTLSGVNVENAQLRGMQSVGGLVGLVPANATLTIENCAVKNSNISNYAETNESGFVAGLVGRPAGTVTISGSAVENTVIDAYYVSRRGKSSIAAVAGGKDNTGATVTNVEVKATEVENVVEVKTVADLAAISPKSIKTVVSVLNDIDMASWTAIAGNYTSFILEGNGHTLKNMPAAIFTKIAPGAYVVRNLNFDNANIHTAYGAGVIVEEMNNEGGVDMTIENCHITNSSIYGWKFAGGFIGFASGAKTSEGKTAAIDILNSSISNTAVSTDDSSCGGFIGHSYVELTIDGCEVLGNSSVSCAEDRKGDNAKAGYLVGTINAGSATISNVKVASTATLTNVNATPYDANGYIGRVLSTGTVNM